MTLLIDPPEAPGHGRLWSHLASDTSFAELHAFARALGVPERGFDRDHYDVPAEWYAAAVQAGATPVSSRELITRLATAGLRRPKAQTLAPRRPGRPLLRPPRLRVGDRVAVVRPAGPVDAPRLSAGMTELESWGLRPVVYDAEGVGALPWLDAPDEARAAALTRAWTDPLVSAVWAGRGGFGSQRLLDLLDWDLLAAATPRLLVGFSDCTALHQAFATRLGVVTVHAQGVAGLDGPSAEPTRTLLMDAGAWRLSGEPQEGGGAARGVLVGGNLTMLASSVGTDDVRPAAGGLAVLEDVGEQPYRLDRALTQLLRGGWFDEVAGVALGTFADCGDPTAVRAVLEARLGDLGVPVLHGLPFGHRQPNAPVPLGVPAVLDVGAGTVSADRTLR